MRARRDNFLDLALHETIRLQRAQPQGQPALGNLALGRQRADDPFERGVAIAPVARISGDQLSPSREMTARSGAS